MVFHYETSDVDSDGIRRILLLAALYPNYTKSALKRVSFDHAVSKHMRTICLSRDWRHWIQSQWFIGLQLLWDAEITQTNRPTLLLYFYLTVLVSESVLLIASAYSSSEMNDWTASLALLVFLCNCTIFLALTHVYVHRIHRLLSKIQDGESILAISTQCNGNMDFFEMFILSIATENIDEMSSIYDEMDSSSDGSGHDDASQGGCGFVSKIHHWSTPHTNNSFCDDFDDSRSKTTSITRLSRVNTLGTFINVNEPAHQGDQDSPSIPGIIEEGTPRVVLTIRNGDLDNASDVSSLSDNSLGSIKSTVPVADSTSECVHETPNIAVISQQNEMKNDDEEVSSCSSSCLKSPPVERKLIENAMDLDISAHTEPLSCRSLNALSMVTILQSKGQPLTRSNSF